MAFTLGIISYKLGVSDPMVGILGCFSQILASICMFLSPYFGAPWLFYVGKSCLIVLLYLGQLYLCKGKY